MVVDDHPMWRDAVERDLVAAGFDVVAVAADGHQALARFPAARPQVVVLDLQIPGPNGVEVTKTVLEQDPSARVLILSASGEQDDVLEAVKAGATGYLVKSAQSRELVDAVRGVAAGGTVFTPGLAGLVLGEFRRMADPASQAAPGTPELTERETEVLKMVAKGMSYKQIAERLVISHRTVQNHVQNTLRKLQMHNRVELTRYAIEQGLDATTTSEPVARLVTAYLSFLGYDDRPPADGGVAGRAAPATPGPGALREPRDHARQAAVGRPARLAGTGGRASAGRATASTRTARSRPRSWTWATPSAAAAVTCGPPRTTGGPGSLNHLVLVVSGLPTDANPGGEWWPDVGLGDAIVEPLPLVVGDYEQGGFSYAITEVRDDGWSFRADQQGSFLGLETGPAPSLADVAECHAALSTPPDGRFARVLVVQRRMADHVDVVRGCLAPR